MFTASVDLLSSSPSCIFDLAILCEEDSVMTLANAILPAWKHEDYYHLFSLSLFFLRTHFHMNMLTESLLRSYFTQPQRISLIPWMRKITCQHY